MNKIKIAIFGLGVVGSHVVKLLEKNSYILENTKCEIVAISAKNKKKKRIFDTSKQKDIVNLLVKQMSSNICIHSTQRVIHNVNICISIDSPENTK